MDNMDMAKLMKMLSSVNQEDLKKSMDKAKEIINSKDKDKILDELKKNLNQ